MVMTTLVYLENPLKTFGMKYAHLSIDLQLSCIVQWSYPNRWKSVVLHPGMMHTLMSFRGCIGTLMKASDVGVLRAFGGIAGIMTGKSCVPTVSLRQCCSRISSRGAKTYQDLSGYMEAVGVPMVGCSGWKPDQALSSSLAVTTRTEKRRLPTPACQPRDDVAPLLCGQHMNYARVMTCYLTNIENLTRQTTIRLQSSCRSTRALSM